MTAQTLEMVCAHIHNYFEVDSISNTRLITQGTFTIANGTIELPFLVPGQYFRIFGSKLNDGVHLYPDTEMIDETFTGAIWEMRPPQSFLQLCDEIEGWLTTYGDAMRNPYQSEEMIGVYRYTKMTSGKVSGEFIATWQNAYRAQLNEWRKLA